MMESRDNILERMRRYHFYHFVEVAPGIVTPGWEAALNAQGPVMAEVKRISDYTGKRVLDVGCRDGCGLPFGDR
jgi:hypothetical protein